MRSRVLFAVSIVSSIFATSAAFADEVVVGEPACEPACRAGYACVKGVCMSACNPPCGASDTCTPAGQCAQKQVTPPPPTYTPSDAPPSDPTRGDPTKKAGYQTHDGGYVRLALGGGGIFSTIKDTNDATVSAGAVALEIAFGGTPFPGFVVGGGIFGASTASQPSLSQGGKTVTIDRATVSMLGLFVDWYPNPKDGWHVQGAVGPTALQLTAQAGGNSLNGTGFGALVGGGYEWFVSEQWSIGILGRLQYASPSVSFSTGTTTLTSTKYESSTWAPALMFAATYH